MHGQSYVCKILDLFCLPEPAVFGNVAQHFKGTVVHLSSTQTNELHALLQESEMLPAWVDLEAVTSVAIRLPDPYACLLSRRLWTSFVVPAVASPGRGNANRATNWLSLGIP
eukprot:11035877-Alexandrium_andersonii.AAC.1